MNLLSCIVVVVFGVSLIGFAITIFIRPAIAERFLNSIASSARAHYLEQVLRLTAGAALVVCSGEMWQPVVFGFLGWLIVITTMGLLCIPWRWHQRFAKLVMPPVIRHMKLYAVAVFGFGTLLLYGVFAGG